MQSMVFYGKGDLRLEERPVPQPSTGEVLVKVMACGICGTDVHIFEGDKGCADTPPGTVLGHEFAGEVVAVGEGVEAVQPGARVCVDPNLPCGGCPACQSGMAHFCEAMTGTGTTVDGGFSQYCVVSEKQVYPIGDRLTYAEAAMVEPLACCLHGLDLCEIKPGEDVVVIGGGMIGMIMVQLARLAGAARVVLAEPVAEKRAAALALGADLAVDPLAGDLGEALEKAGITRVAAVIECVGRIGTIQQAIDIVGKNSVVMMFGLTKPEDELVVKPFEIFKKEITLKSSFINPYTHGRAVALLQAGKLDVASMVVEEIPLGRLAEVLGSDELRRKGKYIVAPWLEI